MSNTFLRIVVIGAFLFGHPAIADVIINHSNGGDVLQFQQRFKSLARRNVKVIIKGECYSSCTLALAYPNACVMPEATLGYHAARDWVYDWRGRLVGISKHINNRGTAVLEAAIPPEVKAKLKPLSFKLQFVKGKDFPERYWCKQ